MKYYLEISLGLILSLLITNGWVMKPISTVYKNNAGNTIVVVDSRWIDSMTLQIFDSTGFIGTTRMRLDSTITTQMYRGISDSIFQQVYLNDSELTK